MHHPIDDLEERYSNQRIEEQSLKGKGRPPKINSSELALNSPGQQGSSKAAETTSKEVVEDRNGDEDAGPMNLVHESISGLTPVTRRKSIYVPDGETKADRDARTIFIGNLPFGILKSKVGERPSVLSRILVGFSPFKRHSSDAFSPSHLVVQGLG